MKTINKQPNLVNAVLVAREHPGTFALPNGLDIINADIGHYLKVCAGAERFWCEIVITEKSLDTSYKTFVGRIDNDLINTAEHGLRYNDLITIRYYNIYQVDTFRKEISDT